MENSPLNKAHQLERRAEALLKQKKFDESIEIYHKSVGHLEEALLQTENVYSRESISLQIAALQKRIKSLSIKKSQYEARQRYNDTMRHKVNFNSNDANKSGHSLQQVIVETIETHDSLIELLMKRGNSDNDESLTASDSDDNKNCGVDVLGGLQRVSGKKHAVNDAVIIEEFRVLSDQLRELVEVLVGRLEDKDREIAGLKEQVCKLECEKIKGQKGGNNLKVITDSSGGTSPYVYSPCSELSPEVNDSIRLPPLAPLEMPNFDFSRLIQTKPDTSTNNQSN